MAGKQRKSIRVFNRTYVLVSFRVAHFNYSFLIHFIGLASSLKKSWGKGLITLDNATQFAVPMMTKDSVQNWLINCNIIGEQYKF